MTQTIKDEEVRRVCAAVFADTEGDKPSQIALRFMVRRVLEAFLDRPLTDVAFLAFAEECGARITGTPDGKEPVGVAFTLEAWQAFATRYRAPTEGALGSDYKKGLLACKGDKTQCPHFFNHFGDQTARRCVNCNAVEHGTLKALEGATVELPSDEELRDSLRPDAQTRERLLDGPWETFSIRGAVSGERYGSASHEIELANWFTQHPEFEEVSRLEGSSGVTIVAVARRDILGDMA